MVVMFCPVEEVYGIQLDFSLAVHPGSQLECGGGGLGVQTAGLLFGVGSASTEAIGGGVNGRVCDDE